MLYLPKLYAYETTFRNEIILFIFPPLPHYNKTFYKIKTEVYDLTIIFMESFDATGQDKK